MPEGSVNQPDVLLDESADRVLFRKFNFEAALPGDKLLSQLTISSNNGRDPENTPCLVDQSGAEGVREISEGGAIRFLTAITIAEEGGKADIAKPVRGPRLWRV
jgi:hypothetical protein